jgi:3-mercaptopyruvate sulfurtransferase SseA
MSLLPLLARTLALVAVGSAAGLLGNALRPDGVRLQAFEPPTACTAPAAVAAGPTVEVLPPDQATTLCGDKGVLIADARAAQRFARGHVAGALHLPCAATGDEASRALQMLAGKHTLIVYGDTTDEARPVAEDVRRRAHDQRLRIVVLEGGFPAWDRAGLACTSGPCPACGEERAR